MNPAKRRRVDLTTSTLRKPFRSPLKVLSKDANSSRTDIASDRDQQKEIAPPRSPSNRCTTTAQSRRSSATLNSTSRDDPGPVLDELTALQKRYSSAAQQLKRLRQDLDVVKQARNIKSRNQTDELDQLILRWQDVARSAAEEMFDITSSRIKEMGGLQAWRKQTHDNSRHGSEISVALRDAHQCSEVCGEENELHDKEPKVDLEEEAEDADDEQQSFTMVTMLRQFNIDPLLLNYDDHNEQWIN